MITQTVYCGVFTFVEKLAGLFLEYKIINPFNLNLKFYSEILRSPLGGQSIVHQVALMYEIVISTVKRIRLLVVIVSFRRLFCCTISEDYFWYKRRL